jgi:hypothetical protein
MSLTFEDVHEIDLVESLNQKKRYRLYAGNPYSYGKESAFRLKHGTFRGEC